MATREREIRDAATAAASTSLSGAPSVRQPLTHQQQWLWRLLQRRPDWRCMVAYTYALRGPLNIALLEESLEAVIRRHGSLRTRIVLVDGEALSQTDAPGPFHLHRVIVTGGAKDEIAANARRWIEGFASTPVEPLTGPWLAIRLLQLTDDEHWLVLAMHRLIGDCASIDLVFRETWTLYAERARDRPSPLNGEAKQYADYATRQRQCHPDWLSRHGAYWNERLAEAAPVRWPVDTPTPAVAYGTLGRMSTRFGEMESEGLKALARRERTLLANVVLAVYVAVLSRWCHQRDFVVPFFVAGRQSDNKAMVGYFSHILYLRIQLRGDESFRQLLSYVGNEFFRALTHQDFGYMAAQRPDLLAGSFCQWITWHPQDVAGMVVPTAADAAVPAADRVTLTDFSEDLTALPPGMVAVEVSFFDTDEGIYASGVYRADLFSAGTLERFMGELRAAAIELAGDPAARVLPEPQPLIEATGEAMP